MGAPDNSYSDKKSGGKEDSNNNNNSPKVKQSIGSTGLWKRAYPHDESRKEKNHNNNQNNNNNNSNTSQSRPEINQVVSKYFAASTNSVSLKGNNLIIVSRSEVCFTQNTDFVNRMLISFTPEANTCNPSMKSQIIRFSSESDLKDFLNHLEAAVKKSVESEKSEATASPANGFSM